MRKVLLFLLVSLILSGCRKEGFVPYTGLETGQVRNGVIVTDNGVNLVVDANPGNYKLTKDRRVVVSYKATASDGPDTYRIDLEELWETSRIEPIAEPSGEHYDDPVRIDEAWFSGGYLNVDVSYDGTEPSLHLFPATYEIADGKILFHIMHKSREDHSAKNYLRSFLCFPLGTLTKEYMDMNPSATNKKHPAIPFLLQWRWYAQEGDTPQGEIILYEKEGTYLPGS